MSIKKGSRPQCKDVTEIPFAAIKASYHCLLPTVDIFYNLRGWEKHLCVSKLGYGLSSSRQQDCICAKCAVLKMGPLGWNVSEIWIKMQWLLVMKTHLKMSSEKWRPFYLGHNVLRRHLGMGLHGEYVEYKNELNHQSSSVEIDITVTFLMNTTTNVIKRPEEQSKQRFIEIRLLG